MTDNPTPNQTGSDEPERLKELLYTLWRSGRDGDDRYVAVAETLQAIRTKYISRAEVEAAIGKLPIFGHINSETGIRTDYVSVLELRRELGLEGETHAK